MSIYIENFYVVKESKKFVFFRVLATSPRHGFLQFVESITVAEVVANEGSILNFFRKHHPSDIGPYGVVPEVMDTYLRSCGKYKMFFKNFQKS